MASRKLVSIKEGRSENGIRASSRCGRMGLSLSMSLSHVYQGLGGHANVFLCSTGINVESQASSGLTVYICVLERAIRLRAVEIVAIRCQNGLRCQIKLDPWNNDRPSLLKPQARKEKLGVLL